MAGGAHPRSPWRAVAGPAASVLGAAALFGLSVPASKLLLDGRRLTPTVLAGLLYLAAGLALAGLRLARRASLLRLPAPAWRRVALVALVGGVAAPLCLTHGLARIDAQVGSGILAVEGALTAALAALCFGEHVGRDAGAAGGLAAIALVVLAAPWSAPAARPDLLGLVLVAAATAGWALDNNLSRALADRDPLQVVALKGLIAGPVSLGIARVLGQPLPADAAALGGAAAVGVLSYGLSLALVFRGFAGLGAARTTALFSTGPAFGALGAWIVLGERPGLPLLLATPLLAASVWLVARERHDHAHAHDGLEHDHVHTHDEHHRHPHGGDEGPEPHRHPHRHAGLAHAHPHAPDLHHWEHRHPGRRRRDG